MPNMCMTKLPMPEQDPKVRARNFEEVSYGYTEEMAIEEAQQLPQLQTHAMCKRLPSKRTDSKIHQPDCSGQIC